MFQQLQTPNPTQSAQISDLIRRCEAFDNASPYIQMDHSLNADQQMNSWILAYDGEQLAGVASVFAPTREEAEIALCVAPEKRANGLGNAAADPDGPLFDTARGIDPPAGLPQFIRHRTALCRASHEHPAAYGIRLAACQPFFKGRPRKGCWFVKRFRGTSRPSRISAKAPMVTRAGILTVFCPTACSCRTERGLSACWATYPSPPVFWGWRKMVFPSTPLRYTPGIRSKGLAGNFCPPCSFRWTARHGTRKSALTARIRLPMPSTASLDSRKSVPYHTMCFHKPNKFRLRIPDTTAQAHHACRHIGYFMMPNERTDIRMAASRVACP